MYPLNVLLVGCSESELPDLRREFTNLAAGVEGEFLDIRGCLEHVLAHPGSMRLLIVRPNSAADIVQLERLNESLVGNPILALVDPTHDASMMVRAMRAGAAQVVRLPVQGEDFRCAMHRIAIQFGHAQGQGRTVVVIGGSEGSGCTTLSLNLASEFGRLRNAPCILGEGAIAFGRLANYLSIEPQVTMYDLICDLDRLDVERVRRALSKVDEHLLVLVGSYRAITPMSLTTEAAFKLLSCARQLAEIVVVDARYHFEELDFDFLAKAEQIVLVAKQTVPSLHSLKLLLEQIEAREMLAQKYVVVNQFTSDEDEFSPRNIAEMLRLDRVFTVSEDVASLRAAENLGQTLRKAAPHSSALADITALARTMLGMPAVAPAPWSFLDSLNRIAHSFHLK